MALAVAAPSPAQETRDSVRARVPLPATPADTLRQDTTRTVTARPDSVPRDTVKSPIAVAPRPALPEIAGRRTTWDRDAIFASGAITLPELLAQLPGITAYHAGFIAAPTVTGWYGEPGRVRVFLDGVEMDALDPRDGGVRDLATIQMWTLEEVAVERAAGELRVYLRSWRVRLTTPQTRTDILTGSENANLYRGFFGKRMPSGGVLQVAAQQFSTTSVHTGGDGDAFSSFGRVGFARGRLTVDGVGTKFTRLRAFTVRNVVSGTLDPTAIGKFEGDDASGYLRAAWGDADTSRFWVQAIAASLRHQESGDSTPGADTARSQSQYVASAGVSGWGARLSATARLRVAEGRRRVAPALHASWGNRWVAASGSAESGGADSTRRVDALVAVTPVPWLHLLGAHSLHTPTDTSGPARTTSRAEAGLRIYGRWVTAGVIQRSASLVQGMPVFDARFTAAPIAASTGLEGGVAGPLFGPFSFAWRGVRWDAAAAYRPEVESHAELRVSTAFARQIPRGTFHLTAAVTHDYVGAYDAPIGGGASLRAEGAGIYGMLLDIRIASAHLFWYNRNSNGTVYETVPGYLMPRLVQLYGVRWEFWN